MIKVYVFKERKCHLCEGVMFADNEKGFTKCTKCGNVVQLNDAPTLGSMSVRLRGTSRSGNVVREMKKEGVEVDTRLVPEKRLCQRCQNFKTMINNMARQRKLKSGTRELSIEEAQQLIKRDVQMQVRNEQEAAKRKAQEKKMMNKKALEMALKGAKHLKKEIPDKFSKEDLKVAEKAFKENILKKKKGAKDDKKKKRKRSN